jgi:hypothetical protein
MTFSTEMTPNLLFEGTFEEEGEQDEANDDEGYHDSDGGDDSGSQSVNFDVEILFLRSLKVAEFAKVGDVGAGVVNDEDAVTSVIRRIDVVVLGPSVVQDFFGRMVSLFTKLGM